jgi:hypothetical protein
MNYHVSGSWADRYDPVTSDRDVAVRSVAERVDAVIVEASGSVGGPTNLDGPSYLAAAIAEALVRAAERLSVYLDVGELLDPADIPSLTLDADGVAVEARPTFEDRYKSTGDREFATPGEREAMDAEFGPDDPADGLGSDPR